MGPFPSAVERFPKVRQSRLSTFDNCALASRFESDYEADWSSHPAARGTIVHRTLARCLRMMWESGESTIPVDVALAELDDVIRQADVEVAGDEFRGEIVSIPLREIAEARITVKTWAMHTTWPVGDIAGVERRMETTLAYPDGQGGAVQRVVTGQVDLLFILQDGETAFVWDWKDTWGIPSEGLESDDDENISEEGYFQQRFYALLGFRTFPRLKRITLVEYYPRYAGGTTKRHGRLINPKREATIHRSQLPDIEVEMSALLERFDRAYETGKFRPAPGSHCSYCVRPEACTIFPSARGVGRIASEAEAERLAARLNVLDAISSQTRKAMRVWSNAHGDVRVRDAKRPRVYGPVVRDKKISPSAEQVREAIARGDDPAELFRVQQSVTFCVHSPEEVHPHVAAVRAEEEELVEMERAAAARKGRKR